MSLDIIESLPKTCLEVSVFGFPICSWFSGTFPIPPCLNFQVGSPYVGSSSNNTGASRMSAPAMNSDQPKIGLKEGINKGLLSFIFLSEGQAL